MNGLSNRRVFLINGSLIMTAGGLNVSRMFSGLDDEPAARFGLLTDLHYADKPAAGTRFYRETTGKLDEAVEKLSQADIDFVVELGDFVDAADDIETELGFLRRINQSFKKIPCEHHYVLGNHCVHTLTKNEFLNEIGKSESFYSFDQGELHFIVLDACFRADGQAYERRNFEWTDPNLSQDEIDWLASELDAHAGPTIVFVHQRLDRKDHYSIKNAETVRDLFKRRDQVKAVFQGHSHLNDYQEIDGVHYCTVAAMVEGSGAANNSYATVECFRDGSIRVNGFRKQQNRQWPA